MMITRACGFVQFDTEDDFNDNVANLCGTLRFEHAIIERPNHFPAVYQYHDAWDAHFCGHWALCEDSQPMLVAVGNRVKELLKTWEKIAEPIDSKQNL